MNQADIDSFAQQVAQGGGNFTNEERMIIQQLFLTITRTSAAIYQMKQALQNAQLFNNLADQAVVSAKLDKLNALLSQPVGADFDFSGATQRIAQMQTDMNNAGNLNDGLQAVLKLASFIAPLALA